MTDTDTAQRQLGELVLKVAEFIRLECENDLQLIVAVSRDHLFQAELAYRVAVLDSFRNQKNQLGEQP